MGFSGSTKDSSIVTQQRGDIVLHGARRGAVSPTRKTAAEEIIVEAGFAEGIRCRSVRQDTMSWEFQEGAGGAFYTSALRRPSVWHGKNSGHHGENFYEWRNFL